MAEGKTNAEIEFWYDQHIKQYREAEQRFLKQLEPKAKENFQFLLNLTNENNQNKEMEENIKKLENLINYDSIINSKMDSKGIQSQIAKQILEINQNLAGFGEDLGGLEALANGTYDKMIAPGSKNVNLVSNSELNSWLVKIMKRVERIKRTGKEQSFTGYLSNLKGAYLESAVMTYLKERIPSKIEVNGETIAAGNFDVFGTGNIKVKDGKKGRQIAEDIILTYSKGGKDVLENILNDKDLKTKSGRTTINIPMYDDIQKQSVGISVKAGSSPIKFFEGNLNKFFTDADESEFAYHTNVLSRAITKMRDNEKGRSVNKFLVAKQLDQAIGVNNLFLSTRNNLLTSMSEEIEYLKYNGQLYMSAYKISGNSITGRIIE